MKCKSGQHEWVSPVNAARCCNPAWERVVVPEDQANTLDINGRIFGEQTCTVSGWRERNLTPAVEQRAPASR